MYIIFIIEKFIFYVSILSYLNSSEMIGNIIKFITLLFEILKAKWLLSLCILINHFQTVYCSIYMLSFFVLESNYCLFIYKINH
jgi:hypothetical protein